MSNSNLTNQKLPQKISIRLSKTTIPSPSIITPRYTFQENLRRNQPDPDLLLLICSYLNTHFPNVSNDLKLKLAETHLLPTCINPTTGRRESIALNDITYPDNKQLPTIISTMIDVASAAAYQNMDIQPTTTNKNNNNNNTSNNNHNNNKLALTSINPSIINILRNNLIHDPNEISKRNKSLVNALSLYHRYQNIFARAKYYESQLKIKLEETQNINSTTLLASSKTTTTTTEGGGGSGEKDGATNDNSSSNSKITKPNGKYSQIQYVYHIYIT